jgi:hypothetical protein
LVLESYNKIPKMKRRLKYLASTFVVVIALSSGSVIDVDPSHVLPIPIEPQQYNNWCYAASISMAVKAVVPGQRRNDNLQCQIAKTHGINPLSAALVSDCGGMTYHDDTCTYGGGSCTKCYKGMQAANDVAVIMSLVKASGAKARRISTGVTVLASIKTAIDNKHPVIGIYKYRGGRSTHAVLIRGYIDNGSGTLLVVNNPLSKAVASCDGCFFVMDTDSTGSNRLNIVGLGAITYGLESTYRSTGKFIEVYN